MTKIVYNTCFGGFGLSEAAMRRYAELKGLAVHVTRGPVVPVVWLSPPGEGHAGDNTVYDYDIARDDPTLVKVIEELGESADAPFAKLAIEEVPPGTPYKIVEYDGRETVEVPGGDGWNIA